MVSLRDQTVLALRQQVAQLVQERDELINQLNYQNANIRAEADPEGEVAQARHERDEARAEVARLTADRLSVAGMDMSVLVGYEAGQREVDRLRALLAEARPLLWQHTLAPPRNTLLTRIDAALEGRDDPR